MEKQSLWKKIVSHVIVSLTMIWIYLPIIAGIITPMVWMLPALYYSWYLFGRGLVEFRWLDGIAPIPNLASLIIIAIFEILIFLLGCYLLVAGIIHLAKARKEKLNVVSTGPYKFIRHPQHLGIILISLPFALVLPFGYIGIRIGDILSFLLNFTLLMIISCIEEINMKQRFPEEYPKYVSETGFFFPKLRKKEADHLKLYTVKTRKELLLSYTLIISLFLIGFAIIVVIMFLVAKYTHLMYYFVFVR